MIKYFLKILGFHKFRENFFYRIEKLLKVNQQSSKKNLYKLAYDISIDETYSVLKDKITTSLIYQNKYKVRDFLINKINQNIDIKENICLEFGVRNGLSLNYFSKYINSQFYGFDTFEGLPDDWAGSPGHKGSFSANGVVPKVNKNVSIVPPQIWFESLSK